MYKVFVENLPVIFTQNSENYPHSLIMEASEVQDINDIVRRNTSFITVSVPLLIQCDQLEHDFNRIFQDYQRVVAAGGIVQKESEVLMIRKNGFLDLPKGFVDQGENLVDCAYREITEECGIQGHQMEQKLTETMHTYFYEDKPVLKVSHWFLFHYYGTKVTVPQYEEGIIEAVWMSMEELDFTLTECYASIREVLECFRGDVKN